MDIRLLIVLIGDTVMMEGVGQSLLNELDLNIIQLDPHASRLQEYLTTLEPDLIIVDLDMPQLATILMLLRERPGTLLLGIDHTTSEVIILRSTRQPIGSIHEFCQLAQEELGCEVRTQKGGEILTLLNHYRTSESS